MPVEAKMFVFSTKSRPNFESLPPGGLSGRGVGLKTDHLGSRLRMSGSIRLQFFFAVSLF